jgi:hypothetical protein
VIQQIIGLFKLFLDGIRITSAEKDSDETKINAVYVAIL